ncbi:MAG: hypothetical protein LBD56_01670 [Endomicrobium sp.]|nr:hypothetical protein [Endomicrobium sp.]
MKPYNSASSALVKYITTKTTALLLRERQKTNGNRHYAQERGRNSFFGKSKSISISS